MKRNISDLLDEYPAENLELGGKAPYSPSRIKELTMNNIDTGTNTRQGTKRFHPARRLLIAAAVAAALTVSAFAADRIFGAGELFQGFFTQGDGSLSQGQLDGIDQLGQTAADSDSGLPGTASGGGAAITPLAAIADENLCYIRLRVQAPEGTVLPDLDGETEGCYQLGASLESAQGAYMSFGYGENMTVLPDDDPTDSCKDFVLSFAVPEGETGLRLNDGSAKVLTVTGLWIQHPDKEYTTLFTGDFAFDFGLSLQSQAIALEAEGLTWHHELFDYTNTVKSLALSPLSLSYCVDSGMPANDSIQGYAGDIRIVLKDGTVFFSQAADYEALRRYVDSQPGLALPLTGQPVGILQGHIPFDQPLDLSQVDYVMYGENKIFLNRQ